MKRLAFRWLLFILLAAPANAVIDPLGTQFFPSIDQTASDYSTSAGTITITDTLYKVFQSSPAPGNVHWAIVYSMENEIQSFQVHVSPSVNISSLTVTMSNLVDTQTVPSTIIYATSTDIVVYREYYLNISTPSSISTMTYYGGMRAWMPHQLIPAVDPYYHQTTNAFPIAVTSTQTQSAWIDVHVPSSAPSGYYSGSVYVSSGNVVISTMPVVYAVWAWVMPSSATLGMLGTGASYNGLCNFYYGSFAACGAYPGAGGDGDLANTLIANDLSVQGIDNRFSNISPNVFPEAGSFTAYNQTYAPLLNGTPSNTTTILPGAVLPYMPMHALSFSAPVWQNFASSFTSRGWMPRLFDYLCDEPPTGCSYAQIISSGNVTRTFSSPVIPNLVTIELARAQANHVEGQIDWITPLNANLDPIGGPNHRADYDAYLATSSGPVRQIGSYEDCVSAGTCGNGFVGPATISWTNRHIDGKPVANRAFETWAFLNRLKFELYFNMDYCVYNNCPTRHDPWHSVYAFGCNGDGTLVVPSSAPYVTTSSNIPIYVPTMLLKYARDGSQDFEYENYLTNQGQGALVQTQIASWLTNAYTFSTDPTKINAARMAMGTAIHQLTYAASTVPVVSSALTASGTVGQAFSYQIIASSSPTSYSASPLPGGVSLNSSSGLLSGTPTTAAVTNTNVSATNPNGVGPAVTVVITIAPAPISTAPKITGNTRLNGKGVLLK